VTLRHTLQKFRDRFSLTQGGNRPTRQFGAIPYTVIENRVVFLLITSRRTGRWIFPKGGAIDGKTPWEVAAHEAYEEAGVEGEMETVPLGTYRDVKGGIRRLPIEVELYPLRLTRQLDNWPEQNERHRHWVILPEARRLLANAHLADLAAALDRRQGAAAQPLTALIAQ
jgi:8-oxo-dGTP pyrophosphatase MutT (NUDIX family)